MMKIRKRLFGLALCLCAVVCVMGMSASAADPAHSSHPICGAEHQNIGDHTGTCGDVTWTAWNGTDEISYDSDTKTAYVYLADSVTLSSALKVQDGYTLYLCLNGKTLQRTYTVISVEGNATLNICDCKGGGEIRNTTPSSDNNTIQVDTAISRTTATEITTVLNLYSGKLSGCANSTVELYNNEPNNEKIAAIFNMYGGEVYNTSGAVGAAVFASYAKIGTGFYGINIYGGTVTGENGRGIGTWNSKNAKAHIAGGTIKGYHEALSVLGDLTLSGKPIIGHMSKNGKDINLSSLAADDFITVTDDFTQTGGATISVEKSTANAGSVIIAKPETGKSLTGKAQYFVSSKEGYFVENKGDDLWLTACAITGQPTAENKYTVKANGNPVYQWYSATRGDVPVTSDIVKSSGSASYLDQWAQWSAFLQKSTVTGFTLAMKTGDVLTLDFSSSYDATIQGVTLSDGTQTINGAEVAGESKKYTLTAPADGDYTLTISAKASYEESSYVMLTFTATATMDILGTALPGQTAAALKTDGLATGSYICQVTWEGKTVRTTQAVNYTAHTHNWDEGKITTPATCTTAGEKTFTCSVCKATKTEPIDATGHKWSNDWTKDATHHWKECLNAGCTEIYNYAEHNGGEATCVDPATCGACGQEYGDPDPAKHAYGTPTYNWNGTQCAATRICIHNHDHTETETVTATVTVTQNQSCTLDELSTYTAVFSNPEFASQTLTNVKTKDKLGHNFPTSEWQSDADHHWNKCSRCDATDGPAPHGWDDGTVKTPAACTTAGVKTYTCKTCAAAKTDEIPAAGHTVVTDGAVAATCTATGLTAGSHCSVCQTTLTAQTVTPVLGHDLTHHDAQAATCTEVGWDAYDTCSRCDYTTYHGAPDRPRQSRLLRRMAA